MFCSLAILFLIASALLWIIGWRSMAIRLFLLGVVLAALAPLMESNLASLSDVAAEYSALLVILAVLVLALAAWIRHVHHRRLLSNWKGDSPTSIKRRVDRHL